MHINDHNALDLRARIERLLKGRIACPCGNSDWEQFIYLGNLPDGGMAGCKLCAHVTVLDDLIATYWQPSDSDLQWCRNLIELFSEHATWETSQAIYQVDKPARTLTVSEVKLPQIHEREHAKVRITFELLGWTVKELNDVRT
jgi:hypothetical protein